MTQPSNVKALQQNQKEYNLNTNKIGPGDMISTNQFEISKPGRLFGSARREVLNNFFGGIIFYDPATKTLKVYFQTSLNAAGTIFSKKN